MYIEVIQNKKHYDSLGYLMYKELKQIYPSISGVRTSKIYYFKSEMNTDFIENLLMDRITDQVKINDSAESEFDYSIGIEYKPGVMDPEALTLREYLSLSLDYNDEVKIIRRFYFNDSNDNRAKISEYMKNIHYNPLIETISESIHFISDKESDEFLLREINLNTDLEALSQSMTLSLNPNEMNVIKEYFDNIGRSPTDIELETIAQTWSEHCVHKTFKSDIDYDGRIIKNLFKSTIMHATDVINHPDAISVFYDNAGIWNFDNDRCICFKVETHNHPSALEPYGGAGTGIGGVIRDVIGTGLGFKPIANTDVFCVGENDDNIPEGTINPRNVLKGIVSGVRDYGNRMGIPTVNGAVHFHPDFAGNPLVYAGSLGIARKKNAFKKVIEGDMIVLVGGKTGRDGIHGATFSSVSLHDQSQKVSSGAVQIGNPIEEKQMLDGILEADGLYNAITDCGAGGLSSAVGEMGEHTGAEVNLDNVPLKYNGLTYDEIWISESQERMILAVPSRNYDSIKEIMNKHGSNISHIGYFRGKNLSIYYRGTEVCSLSMDFLHNGVPGQLRKAEHYVSLESCEDRIIDKDLNSLAEAVISDRNVASKEWIIRQYDYEVMAQTIMKPLTGIEQDSCSDAAVLMPLNSSKAIVIGNGINPHYGRINPKKMTYAVIDEAMRNILAQGADMEHTAILDNFSWGDVNNNTGSLGALVESAEACRDYAIRLGTPFISGKDSLNNYFKMKDNVIEIPHTLLISAISVADIQQIRGSYFKHKDNLIYLLGKRTAPELSGSVLYRVMDMAYQGIMPDIDINESAVILEKMNIINKMRIAESAHDISDGGLFVSLMEMTFGSGLGADIEIHSELPDYQYLFSETQTRFIIEIKSENAEIFEKTAGTYCKRIGSVTSNNNVNINYNNHLHTFDIKWFKSLWKGKKDE